MLVRRNCSVGVYAAEFVELEMSTILVSFGSVLCGGEGKEACVCACVCVCVSIVTSLLSARDFACTLALCIPVINISLPHPQQARITYSPSLTMRWGDCNPETHTQERDLVRLRLTQMRCV